MVDMLSPEERSRLMARIRSKDTRPERIVRSYLHGLGYRYRLHAPDLPGRPDIVFRKRRVVVFVHGCYWHRHKDCRLAYTPKSRPEFWKAKFAANVARDRTVSRELTSAGWKVLVVWECQTRLGELDWLRAAIDSAYS